MKEIYCPRMCSRGAPPVCAWFPYTLSNGTTGGRDMAFGSRCVLDSYACRNAQGGSILFYQYYQLKPHLILYFQPM